MLKPNNLSEGIGPAVNLINLLIKKDENEIKIKGVYKYNKLITVILTALYNNNS